MVSQLFIYTIIAIILIIISLIFLKKKYSKTIIRLIFLDFKKNNYYNKISIELNDNFIYKGAIDKKNLILDIFQVKMKNIANIKLKIMNSENNEEKAFKISVYKNYTNNINIKINNLKRNYYYSEIIFYGDNIQNNIKINNTFYYNSFNLKKRIRLIICNFSKKELKKIIEKNISDKALIKRTDNELTKNSNQFLLINIFIGQNISNILIFIDKEDILIIPNKNEKKLFEDFYNTLNFGTINTQCYLFLDELYSKEKLFDFSIVNKNKNEKEQIYISFINQGINCLLGNNIITSKDKKFILGYMILLFFICNGYKAQNMRQIKLLLIEMEKNKLNEIEQIKVIIACIIFFLNYSFKFNLIFNKDLPKDDEYLEGFKFFEDIVKELNEESELILMFLQLNSGSGFELLNGNNCYKISMISVEEIKSHLINNIPKYFFIYEEETSQYVISDQRTQVLAFNDKELLKYRSKDETTKKNNVMNVVIGLFHESGHQKFHMNDKIGAKRSPILYIQKDFSIGIQKDELKKKECGEAGRCVDSYLYENDINLEFLFNSNNSYRLMEKTLFLGKLNELNQIASNIAKNYFEEQIKNYSLNLGYEINNLDYPFIKKRRKKFEYDFIIKDGNEIPCGVNVDE